EARTVLIPNGYDEHDFALAEATLSAGRAMSGPRRIVLLHSGVLYPSPDRDPSHFFAALRRLADGGRITPADVHVVLRAAGHEAHHRTLIREMGVAPFVSLEPPIGYHQALREMLQADGLLLFQGRDSNTAIPAKVYEYFRARRPIFAMVDPDG